MPYEIVFIPDAAREYENLDGSLRKQADSKLKKLQNNPYSGEALGNKNNVDLSGFYKLYFAKKRYRIVYRIRSDGSIEIIEIWGIGKRDKMEIYKIVSNRINTSGK